MILTGQWGTFKLERIGAKETFDSSGRKYGGTKGRVPAMSSLKIYLQIPRLQSLTNRTHPTPNPPLRHLIRQRLLQRTLRDARIVQVTEAAAHARRPVAAFFCRAALLGG